MASPNSSPSRLVVLISGSGTNLQALIDASNTPSLPNASIVRVISDRKDAYGLQRAKDANIPTTYHGILPYKKAHPDPEGPKGKFEEARKAYDAELANLILDEQPDLVVCAGFMRILTTSFLNPVAAASVPIINLHPSLHGDLIGAGCIQRAWEEFQQGKRTETGVMVHYVIAEVDMGEPILQKEVDMKGCQSLEELEERIHTVEHEIIVEGAKVVLEKGER